MLAITQLYVMYGRVIESQQASIEMMLGGSSIMDTARAAGLQAGQVVASHSFSGTTYATGATTVVFELPAVDISGGIVPGAYDYIAVFSSGSNVYRLVDAAAESARISEQTLLTDVLGALSFSYDNPDFPSATRVTVDATTSIRVRGVAAEAHFYEQIYLRNI